MKTSHVNPDEFKKKNVFVCVKVLRGTKRRRRRRSWRQFADTCLCLWGRIHCFHMRICSFNIKHRVKQEKPGGSTEMSSRQVKPSVCPIRPHGGSCGPVLPPLRVLTWGAPVVSEDPPTPLHNKGADTEGDLNMCVLVNQLLF